MDMHTLRERQSGEPKRDLPPIRKKIALPGERLDPDETGLFWVEHPEEWQWYIFNTILDTVPWPGGSGRGFAVRQAACHRDALLRAIPSIPCPFLKEGK